MNNFIDRWYQNLNMNTSHKLTLAWNACTSQLHSSTRDNAEHKCDVNRNILLWSFKTREGNSLKFHLKGTAMRQRELSCDKTCKGGAQQNFLPSSTYFHSPQEKYRLIPNNITVLILERYRHRKVKYVSTRGHNNKWINTLVVSFVKYSESFKSVNPNEVYLF